MTGVRIPLIKLLGLYVIFCGDHRGFSLDTVLQLPQPRISRLQNVSMEQTLLVYWPANHSSSASDIYEIQIGRAENRTVIYSRNVSLPPVDSHEYTWRWTSDLPLECVDHSVRIRLFSNRSVASPWSSWMTNHGFPPEDQPKIYPNGRVLREGSTARFCCVPPRGDNVTSIIFRKEKFPLTSVGARVKSITVRDLKIPTTYVKTLLFTCTVATGNSGDVWNYVSFPPQKPRNLSCVTSDMTVVTCTWGSDRERYKYDRNKQTQTLRIENSDQAPFNCQLSSCTFRAVPQLEKYNISVVVKNQLGEETESHSFTISDRVCPVVEWDPVIPGVMDASLSWTVLGNLTQLSFLCQVKTDPGDTTEVSCSGLSGLCRVKLERLLPNTRFSSRVRCSVSGHLWGKWTDPLPFKTYPLVTLDLWRRIEQQSDPNSRQVTLMWIPSVPGSAAEVNIQGYTVQWSQGGQSWVDKRDSGQTETNISVNAGRYNLTVQAVIPTGVAVPAHIVIPESSDREKLLVKRLSGGAGFALSWEEQDAATCGYVVECIMGTAAPCTLQWMKVSKGNNTLSLPAGGFQAGCRYTFNIYECAENEHRLLEIQSGYTEEFSSVPPPSLEEPLWSTSSSVALEWRYDEDSPALPAFITGYQVEVQAGGSDLPSGQQLPYELNVSDPRKKSLIIGDLQQSRSYSFTVSALTKEGPGEAARITIKARANNSYNLAEILTPVLLLCCVALLWPQRKMLSSRLKDIFIYPPGMNIQTQEFDRFLHETSEWLQSQQVEECSSCSIEILNTTPLQSEAAALKDLEPPVYLPCAGSQSHSQSSPSPVSCVAFTAGYCPQLATVLLEQHTLCISNKTYCHSLGQEVMVSENTDCDFREPAETLQESCTVVCGYIPTNTIAVPNELSATTAKQLQMLSAGCIEKHQTRSHLATCCSISHG